MPKGHKSRYLLLCSAAAVFSAMAHMSYAEPVTDAQQNVLEEGPVTDKPLVVEQEPDWYTVNGRLTMTLEGSARRRGGTQIASVEYMSADRLNGPGGVAFMCANGDVIAAISLTGRESTYKLIAPTITSDRNKQRRLRPQLEIDGKSESNSQWVYHSDNEMIVPINPKFSKQIYNAAILRQTVVLKDVKRMNDIVLHLPEPNEDFAYYGSGCGMGRNAQN